MAAIDQLLSIVQEAGASDLHLGVGQVPTIRVAGELQKTSHRRFDASKLRDLLYELINHDQVKSLEQSGDLSFSYRPNESAHFRFNLYQTTEGLAVAVRIQKNDLLQVNSLGFPQRVIDLLDQRSGILAVVGPSGSGRSTTLNAMIDHINTTSFRHIVIIDDADEHLHQSKNSLISQRKVGTHSESYATAASAALREDPDVISIADLNDSETASAAFQAVEGNRLVLLSLQAMSAKTAVERIIELFEKKAQTRARGRLADSLMAVIAQQLLPTEEDESQTMVFELMTASPTIVNLIREGKTVGIPAAIKAGRKNGMRLFDNQLRALVDSGKITSREAAKVAVNPTPFTDLPGKRPVEELEMA